ncbi:hypothetical protein ACFPYI_06845 [Halomarina salina]|uniref:Uncharacterized protein n=1 Tax=Halomarina salina TaxID=1872699 RepID=A0ABD5RKZ9_9EURY|nr:hypothetical protein [Halomarina salina]
MLFQEVVIAFGALVVFGAALYTLNEQAFRWSVAIPVLAIAVPLFLLVKALGLVIGFTRLVWVLIRMTAKALVKTVLFLVITILLTALVFLTAPIPRLGRKVRSLKTKAGGKIDFSGLAEQCRYMRGVMVDIMVEQRDISLSYSTEGRYREELVDVRETGKKRLEDGELVLSLGLGAVLLISQATGLRLFQLTYHDVSASLAIQLILLVIVLSIVYRVWLIDFMAYDEEEEFTSLEQMDVALTYQKAVAYVGTIKSLMFALTVALEISGADHQMVSDTLTAYRDGEPLLDALRNARDT